MTYTDRSLRYFRRAILHDGGTASAQYCLSGSDTALTASTGSSMSLLDTALTASIIILAVFRIMYVYIILPELRVFRGSILQARKLPVLAVIREETASIGIFWGMHCRCIIAMGSSFCLAVTT